MNLDIIKNVIDKVILLSHENKIYTFEKYPSGKPINITENLEDCLIKSKYETYLESLDTEQLKLLIAVMYLGRDYTGGNIKEHFDEIYSNSADITNDKSALINTLCKLTAGEYIQRGEYLLKNE